MYGYPRYPHYSYHPHFAAREPMPGLGYEDYYAGEQSVRAGLSLPGLLFPPAGIAEWAYESGQGGGSGGGRIERRHGGGGGGGGFNWSLLAKAGVLVGGAFAIYVIYKTSTGARAIQEETGSAATKILLARGGKGAGVASALGGLLGSASGSAAAALPAIEVKQLKA